MKKTKNQHYVPQLLLKFFGWKDKKAIKTNIFDISNSSARYNQSIAKICSSNYFYDKNNMVENILSQKIESPVEPLIRRLIDHDIEFLDSPKDSIHLLIFISTLLSRTPKTIDKIDSFIQTYTQSAFRELMRLNHMDYRNADEIKLAMNDKASLISLFTLQSYYASILLTDLKFHLVINMTELDFFISDHPVFLYNWLYRNLDYPGITGFASQGIQFFLPLSPQVMLCLYDSKAYKYGSKCERLTAVHNIKDIEILNSFQAINSKSFIIFSDCKSEANIKKMLHRYSRKNCIHIKV